MTMAAPMTTSAPLTTGLGLGGFTGGLGGYTAPATMGYSAPMATSYAPTMSYGAPMTTMAARPVSYGGVSTYGGYGGYGTTRSYGGYGGYGSTVRYGAPTTTYAAAPAAPGTPIA